MLAIHLKSLCRVRAGYRFSTSPEGKVITFDILKIGRKEGHTTAAAADLDAIFVGAAINSELKMPCNKGQTGGIPPSQNADGSPKVALFSTIKASTFVFGLLFSSLHSKLYIMAEQRDSSPRISDDEVNVDEV